MGTRQNPPVSIAEAAADLGLSAHTIRSWVRTRRIGHVRLGRAIRIPISEVNRLLEVGFTPAVLGLVSSSAIDPATSGGVTNART